jgi:tetratricopeptide (TPR) repeat protein
MFKKVFVTLCLLPAILPVLAQTSSEWQQDLRHLQKVVHSKYKNLFHTTTAAEWDRSVDSFYTNIPALQKHEIIAGFAKLIAKFHIGHTEVNIFGYHDEAGQNLFNRLPVQFYLFSDGLYITAADKRYADLVGGKVVSIGNLKTEDALQAIRPVVNYENEQGFKYIGMFYLRIPELLHAQKITSKIDEVPITYLKNGVQKSAVLAGINIPKFSNTTGMLIPAGWVSARDSTATPISLKEPSSFRYMELLKVKKTLYVRHSATANDGDKTIARFFKEMEDFIKKNDIDKLILDVRMNGGGNNYLNKPIITSIIRCDKINKKGKFFCIIGRRTFSAAQNLVNELERYTEVTFVGEPTSENVNFFGDTKQEVLPNSKLVVNLSWMWWQNHDPRDKRTATFPELAVEPTFADYRSNRDRAIETIFEYENQPFLQKFTSLVSEGKLDEAYKFAKDYKANPVHKFATEKMEADINQEGYNRMNSNIKDAHALFALNMKLFPESANAVDSYAESLMNMGKKDEAIKYYELAIQKDKVGVTAENARRMIAQIKSTSK